MDIDTYATVWSSLLFGAAFGAACCSLMPTRYGNWALVIAFIALAGSARPLIQWAAA